MTRVLIEQNVMEDIAVPPFTGDGRIIQLLQNLSQLTIRNNSFTTSSSTLGQFLNIGSSSRDDRLLLHAQHRLARTLWDVRVGLRRGREIAEQHPGAGGVPRRRRHLACSARPRIPRGRLFVRSLAEAQSLGRYGADEARVRAIARLVVIP